MTPWTDVTFTGVYWNDPERVRKLLEYVRPWFANVVVGVQTDSPEDDPTLEVARGLADHVVVDRVAGYCEPTIGQVLARVPTEWTLLVSADETPSLTLLGDMQAMVDMAAHGNDYTPYDGFWIRFRSSIEGYEFLSEQDNHLRMFRTRLGWPRTMHSRPPTVADVFWRPEAYISHDRSLDEMMQDYLRYYREGMHNAGWVAHNRVMMHDACAAIAERKGWDFVKSFDWWPSVEAIAFKE